MARVTLIAFALLTGFFYVTGKPVDENGLEINRFADFGKHKLIAAHTLEGNSAKHLMPRDKLSSQKMRSDQRNKAETHNKRASANGPTLPSRNPRRIANRSSKYAKLTPVLRKNTPKKFEQLAKIEPPQTFSEGRNKFTGGTIKPLGQSYQQRYVKSQKPVLGPRLTAVLVKRELRRVGCYSGNVTSVWDDSARAAITFYNSSTGSRLTTKAPLVSSLERLQQVTKTVCVEKPVINGTTVASVGKHKAATRKINRASKWRTKVRVRKATFRPSSTARTQQYEITRPRLVERYIAPPSTKPRKAKRTHRAKRLKRIRIVRAKRKARRRTAVRSWRKRYRRKRFGFSNNGGSFTLNN